MNTSNTPNPAAAAPASNSAQGRDIKQIADLKLIVFDMGKVFIRFDWEQTYTGFVSATNSSVDSVKEAFAAVYFPYERGHINTQDVIDHLNKELKANLSHEEFAKLWTATLGEDTEMTQLLQELRQKFPLYMLWHKLENLSIPPPHNQS